MTELREGSRCFKALAATVTTKSHREEAYSVLLTGLRLHTSDEQHMAPQMRRASDGTERDTSQRETTNDRAAQGKRI